MSLPNTLAELAAAVGCHTYPPRWESLYPQILAQFKAEGCIYARPEYYRQLHQEYGILPNELELYCQAAAEVQENEILSLYLFFMCKILEDWQTHSEALNGCYCTINEDDSIGKRMVNGLAVACQAPMCYQRLSQYGLDEDIIQAVLRAPEGGVHTYRVRHNGKPGYELLWWFQLAIDGELYRIGRLEYQMNVSFRGRFQVFENDQEQRMLLAHDVTLHASGRYLGCSGFEDAEGSWTAMVTETPDAWVGYPIRDDATVENRLVTLHKSSWKRILSAGDPVIAIHIPAGGGLPPQLVDESLARAKAFFAEHFPEYRYKAFTCHSWMMDPQLQNLLPPQSNLCHFNRRFSCSPTMSRGDGVFNFVYLMPNMQNRLEDLPENTTLERALKKHYLEGKYIYELVGCLR